MSDNHEQDTPVNSAALVGAFANLVDIVARLRAPDGCPWDREQTHASVARNITEEAAEVVDAIECNDLSSLREELGDLLLQVLLQSQIAHEAGEFTLNEVINGIAEKLVRRHPHVFGSEAALQATSLSPEARQAFEQRISEADNPEAVLKLWDSIKIIEREQLAGDRQRASKQPASNENLGSQPPSILDSVPNSLPALMQAQDVSRKAISVGFDWGSLEDVWNQAYSEIAEYRAEATGSLKAADEFGDILFSLVNVGLRAGIDAESALRSTIRRFRLRWAIMDRYAHNEGRELSSYSLDQLEVFWQRAKSELATNEPGG
ncbi:MAG: nucleoside triphosphate pyrophosphohydrolase [Coriobacteriales bacterium]|nr:nucleoside triphosphate pyrophosphohydrolase [Coriobacteriales bacterium]